MNKSPYNMAVTLELARKALPPKIPTMAERACPYDGLPAALP